MSMYVGIVPRVKRTVEGEARPTLVCIRDNSGEMQNIKLETEQDELDFALGHFPTGYRNANSGEDTKSVPEHLIIRDDQKEAEKKGRELKPDKIPSGYVGLQVGDIVAMALGGCGDNFAFALSKRSEQLGVGTKVIRITPFLLKQERAEESKDSDHILLAKLAESKPELFSEVVLRDRKTIRVRECLRVRTDVMKARIACEQRLRQRFIGQIFCSENGLYPEGSIEKAYDELKANDTTLNALLSEEAKAERELEKAVKETEVFNAVFGQVEGAGYKIASRIIAVVGDIRRFETSAKLRKYLGVHVLDDGRFPRRRAKEVAGWSGEARQALFLLAEQFNRRPDSEWGKYLRLCKTRLRAIHPEKVVIDGKTRYSDGHIHKMGSWRCMSRFVEWMFAEWWKLEKGEVKTQDSAKSAA